jgi:uncharacterized protein (TIGR02186 family)
MMAGGVPGRGGRRLLGVLVAVLLALLAPPALALPAEGPAEAAAAAQQPPAALPPRLAQAQIPPPPPPPPVPPPAASAARPALVSELSQDRVEITTGFSGTEVLVFGATERLLGAGGDDVLVVAQGAAEPMVVRRKIRVLGFWMNGPSARFRNVPGFYVLTGTRPLRDMLEPEELQAKRLGLAYLPLQAAGNQQPEFREALLDLKQRARLWHEEEEPLQVSGARLFRARLPLPATVATGDYLVQVMLVRDGRILARQELSFRVDRVGTAASIADLADFRPLLYGVMCVLLAALAGWLGSVLFRRN